MTAMMAMTVAHGLPIIPMTEDKDAYLAHQQRIISELSPVGSIEYMYAERVSRLMWRLERLKRQEAYSLARPLQAYEEAKAVREAEVNKALRGWWEKLDVDDYVKMGLTLQKAMILEDEGYMSTTVDEIEGECEEYFTRMAGLETLRNLDRYDDGRPIDGKETLFAIWAIAYHAGVADESEDGLYLFVPGESETYNYGETAKMMQGWTAGRAKAVLAFMLKNARATDTQELIDDTELINMNSVLFVFGRAIREKRKRLEEEYEERLDKLMRRAIATFSVGNEIAVTNFEKSEQRALAGISEAMEKLEKLKAKRQPQTTITISPMPLPMLQSGVTNKV